MSLTLIAQDKFEKNIKRFRANVYYNVFKFNKTLQILSYVIEISVCRK